MVRKRVIIMGLGLILTGCKKASGSTSTVTPANTSGNPLVQQAQEIIDQSNQGRACTTLTKKQLETVIDRKNPEFAKRQVLINHGVVKAAKVSGGGGTLDWQVYTNVDLKEADGNGIFIADGTTTYYCFGRWHVTEAVESNKLPVPDDKKLLIATVELTDAVPWVKTDPAAQALAAASVNDDPAYLGSLNEYDKVTDPSYTKSNQVPVAIDKK